MEWQVTLELRYVVMNTVWTGNEDRCCREGNYIDENKGKREEGKAIYNPCTLGTCYYGAE